MLKWIAIGITILCAFGKLAEIPPFVGWTWWQVVAPTVFYIVFFVILWVAAVVWSAIWAAKGR